MEFEFKINENDFLTYQLYSLSRSKKIKRNRLRSRTLIPILYLTVCFIFLFLQNYPMAFGFFLISILWFAVYPMYEKKRYEKQFKKYIAENYKERFSKNSMVSINDEYWHTRNEEKEAKFPLKNIAETIEIESHIFIRLKSGLILIIPKRGIPQIEELSKKLKDSALKHSSIYIQDLNWEWK